MKQQRFFFSFTITSCSDRVTAKNPSKNDAAGQMRPRDVLLPLPSQSSCVLRTVRHLARPATTKIDRPQTRSDGPLSAAGFRRDTRRCTARESRRTRVRPNAKRMVPRLHARRPPRRAVCGPTCTLSPAARVARRRRSGDERRRTHVRPRPRANTIYKQMSSSGFLLSFSRDAINNALQRHTRTSRAHTMCRL